MMISADGLSGDTGKEEVKEDDPGRLREKLLWLYLFAFWSQFKPSEPFLVDYLIEEKGIGSEQVYQDVLDLFVYSRLPFLIIVGFCAEFDCCGYRAVLVVGALCGVVTVLMTRFGMGICSQQAAQFTVSAAFASRVAVPSMAFTLCLPSQFQEAIHTLKAVMLFANCCAAALGELLRDAHWFPLSFLFDLSALGQVLSLLCAACLPLPRASPTATPTAISNTLEEHLLSRSPRRCSQGTMTDTFQALLQDLWLSLWLRRVMWWTAWALAMNPIHGLTLTYWQSMVRSKHILKDHNGYLSACMYFAASVLTLGAGGAWALQRSTSILVVASIFLAAYLLLQLSAADTRQLTVYGWIMLYQCLFEVVTAVATFQVGAEVTMATAASHSKALRSSEVRRLPRCARLTLLFSATTVLVAAAETGILFVINGWESMESRFHCLGICLSAVGLVLSSFALVEAWSYRSQMEPTRA